MPFTTAEGRVLETGLGYVVALGIDVHLVQICMHDGVGVDQIPPRDCMHVARPIILQQTDIGSAPP